MYGTNQKLNIYSFKNYYLTGRKPDWYFVKGKDDKLSILFFLVGIKRER